MRTIVNTALVMVVVVAGAAAPGLAAVNAYTQDFEALNQADTGALANDGWLVYGNVYESDGSTFVYGYGPFVAPNDGAAFCAIATGEGGPEQGAQQLSVYSDYNNTSHEGDRIIESIVYREWTVEADDVGKNLLFVFDAKFGNLGGSSTAEAFIKTLDPGAGYATTNYLSVDMTAIPTTWGTYTIPFLIDATLDGQLFQIGFSNRASGYEDSGIFYDNIDLQVVPPALTVAKSSNFIVPDNDHDGSGTLTGGDTLVYTISVINYEAVDALGVVITDTPDPNTALTVGTVTTSAGTITSGNNGGDTSVIVDVGTLAAGAEVIVEFEVTLDDPLAPGVSQITNQASLTGDNVDPTTSNPTVDVIGVGPVLQNPVPTLSTWSRVLFILLLAGAAAWKLRG